MSLNPAVGNLLSSVFRFRNVATDVALNVLHWQIAAIGGTVPDGTTFLTVMAGQLLTNMATAWKPPHSDQVSLVSCKVTNIFPLPRSVGVTAVETVPVKGESLGEALPLQDAVTILKRTAVGNRWGLGRMYVTGISESMQSNGIISAEYQAALAPLITFIGGPVGLVGAGWTANIVPVLKRGPDDNPLSITRVINAQLSNTIIKSQRRRRPGKGI